MYALYIEDILPHIQLMQRIFSCTSHELAIATSARKGLDCILATSPDLVLVDINLPDTDGLTLVQYLRESGFVQPIVAVTAYASDRDKEHCLAIGCTSYISKPYDVDYMLNILNKYGSLTGINVTSRATGQ